MPAQGTSYKTGKRDLIFTKEFYQQFIEETKIDIDFKTFKLIIIESNKEIASTIINHEDGFKLPENLGYIVITKYKSRKKPIDFYNTRKLKRTILLPNVHSFGYIHHIKWFRKSLVNFLFHDVYKLQPYRDLKRGVAKKVKEGKAYGTWTIGDFWSKNKTLRKLHK